MDKCVKNTETCKYIPPGSCGRDCHGFEPGIIAAGTTTHSNKKSVKVEGIPIKLWAEFKALAASRGVTLQAQAVEAFKQYLQLTKKGD